MYLGSDPHRTGAAEQFGLYGVGPRSAAETASFQQQLLGVFGVRPEMPGVNMYAQPVAQDMSQTPMTTQQHEQLQQQQQQSIVGIQPQLQSAQQPFATAQMMAGTNSPGFATYPAVNIMQSLGPNYQPAATIQVLPLQLQQAQAQQTPFQVQSATLLPHSFYVPSSTAFTTAQSFQPEMLSHLASDLGNFRPQQMVSQLSQLAPDMSRIAGMAQSFAAPALSAGGFGGGGGGGGFPQFNTQQFGGGGGRGGGGPPGPSPRGGGGGGGGGPPQQGGPPGGPPQQGGGGPSSSWYGGQAQASSLPGGGPQGPPQISATAGNALIGGVNSIMNNAGGGLTAVASSVVPMATTLVAYGAQDGFGGGGGGDGGYGGNSGYGNGINTGSGLSSASTSSAGTDPSSGTSSGSSASSDLTTPPGPRPTSCGGSDYDCQFRRSCYDCYGDHSLSYCPDCLALLQCNGDNACQMGKAKTVCDSLKSARQSQPAACKLLAKLPPAP